MVPFDNSCEYFVISHTGSHVGSLAELTHYELAIG